MDLNDAELTDLGRTVSGNPTAHIADVRLEPVDYPIGTPTTAALYRVFGTADGVAWSCFVKHLQSVRHWAMLDIIPEPFREEFVQNLPWQLEIAVHRSNLADLLPEGMRLPKAYRIDLYDDDRGALWMENVIPEPGPWPISRFERAAYLLGRLSARRQPHLVGPLLPRTGVTTPGAALRYYTNGRVTRTALPAIAAWTGDPALRDDLLALGARLPAVLDALDALPQCYQHGDASPQNLLVPQDSPDEFVVIDWGFDCPQAVGFDLGQLLIGLAHAGELSPDALPAVHKVILQAFQTGLAEEGLHIPEAQVLYGYLGSLCARAAFTALPLTEPSTPELLEQRIHLTRVLVDLISPVV